MFKLNKILKYFLCICFFSQISTAFQPFLDEENKIECNFTSITASWRESCNWCRCTENGRALCTRRGCPPALNTRLSGEKECKGDAQWKKDCDWCLCDEGRAVCTSSDCGLKFERASSNIENIERPLSKSIERSVENEPECEMITEDGSWKNSCNWCRCDGGKQLCTRKLCHPDLEEKSEGSLDCNGKVKWKKGCERCECVDGYAVCTPESCKPNEEVLCKVNEKGSRFRSGCNWCACRKGRPICTKIGCKPDDSRIASTPACEGDISWKEDCNWCRCVNGSAKCTEKLCDDKCREGASWVEGCNTCICTNGSSFCTRKACQETVTDEIQPVVLKNRANELAKIAATFESQSKTCTEGSEWLSGCNWCTCENEVPVCTEKACQSDNNSTKLPYCVKDSKWKEDCNTCECLNGIPVCTKIDCETNNQGSTESYLLKSSKSSFELKPSEDCTEGSRWKVSCNWCNCMNGKGACTLMGCLKEFKNNGPECENGSVWRNSNCSICHCEEEKAICDVSSCPTESTKPETVAEGVKPTNKIQPNEECSVGSRWKVDCNWCFCQNGFELCSLKNCLPKKNESEGPQCVNDSQWLKDNCTFCFCENEKAICFPINCKSEVSENDIEQEMTTITTETPSPISPSPKMAKELSSDFRNQRPLCSEGSRWVDRCNWCTCANGVGLCEQKACTSDVINEMDKTCEGKSRWKDDCNWCRCENGKGNCTTNDCNKVPAVNDPVTEDCKAGSTWLEDCNICICTNRTSVCTKKECNHSRSAAALCPNNEMWKDGCNTCRCLRGEEACTREVCSPTFRSSLPEICYLPPVTPDSQLCAGFEAKWTFIAKSEKCEAVVYGGCGGTENLFANEQECLVTCGNEQPKSYTDLEQEDMRERCFMPVVPGPCFGQLIRYAFFPERNRCEKFYYGGCQGNQNNFESLDECYSMCGGSPPSVGNSEHDMPVEA